MRMSQCKYCTVQDLANIPIGRVDGSQEGVESHALPKRKYKVVELDEALEPLKEYYATAFQGEYSLAHPSTTIPAGNKDGSQEGVSTVPGKRKYSTMTAEEASASLSRHPAYRRTFFPGRG